MGKVSNKISKPTIKPGKGVGKVKKNLLKRKQGVNLAKKTLKNLPKATKIIRETEELDDCPEPELDPFVSKNESDEGSHNSDGSEHESEHESDKEMVENEDEVESHKKSLQKLMETDPDFYTFLQENDTKLLNFGVSDDEGSDDEESPKDNLHKPEENEELAIASDESDYEEDDDSQEKSIHTSSTRNITLKLIKTWRNDIKTDKTNKTIGCLINAFHAAIVRVSTEENVTDGSTQYKVDGSSVFNAVIQVCVLELGPAIRRFLGYSSTSSHLQPHKCKRFPKLKTLLKCYFQDLLQLLQSVSSTNILIVVLKHLHYMSPMLTSFLNVTKPLLKKLISLWGTGEETIRVVAFLCVLRITNNQKQVLLDTTLKQMYMTYVKNSKFVSVNTLPMVNFMRRSLVEIFALDVNVSYHHVFLYIRQLAIHLRNAIIIKKMENVQVVYNWQYVNSLRLWGNLLSASCNKVQLQPLIYPFVQICLGSLKLLPTTQYFPLRFHITQILIDLSRDTGVFIPVLPFLLEVLNTFDFNKKHQKVSMKPLHFTCILRVSKSQQVENGFKDTIIETVYGQILQYLANQSHSIAFPDLSFTPRQQLKQFLNKCSIVNYTRKIRQLIDKIEQNSDHIEKSRRNVNFTLINFKLIDAWETTVKNNGTPLHTFFDSWDKVHRIKKGKQATGSKEIGEYNLPTLTKKKTTQSQDKAKSGNDGGIVLFPSDDESEEEQMPIEEEMEGKKRKRAKRGAKKDKKKPKVVEELVEDDGGNDEADIVEDINTSDW